MKHLTTYLTFDGTCKDAMTFYAKCLDAELILSPMSEAPGVPPGTAGERIMHARLSKNGAPRLMASDSMVGHPLTEGTNFSVAIECESVEEIDALFAAFAEGGTVTMPVTDTFWNARFGMLKDKFGIHWMFNFEKPKA